MNQYILSALMRKARRDRAKYDIEYFAEYYLPHLLQNKTPEFHREIRRLLLTENRLGIAAPRGFAKSTVVQIIYALHRLLFNEGEDILTISMSSQLAEDWVRKIRMEFESNEKVANDFGTLLQWGEKDSKRWTTDHLVIMQGNHIFSQIRARGRGCQVRGLRPTKVICDDLEDEEMVRSEEQRKFLREWFLGALLNVLKTDQQLVVIGTILHPLSLLNYIITQKEEFAGWTVRKYKALDKNGKSLWSDRFPTEDLLKRKFEIGTYAFEAEFQNNPIASDICLWRPEWIKTWDKLPDMKFKMVALDPAATEKESSDHSSLSCVGMGVDGKVYEIETIKGRWGTWDLIDRCIKFYLRHQPLRFGIEELAFQGFIRPILLKAAKDQGVFMPIEKVALGRYTGKEKERKTPKDKYTRALSIIHLFEQNLAYLKTQELIDQISLFPTGSEDDEVDAFVFAVRMILKHCPIKIMIKKEEHKEIKTFEVKNNTIPPLVPEEDWFKREKDWKIGG